MLLHIHYLLTRKQPKSQLQIVIMLTRDRGTMTKLRYPFCVLYLAFTLLSCTGYQCWFNVGKPSAMLANNKAALVLCLPATLGRCHASSIIIMIIDQLCVASIMLINSHSGWLAKISVFVDSPRIHSTNRLW